MCVVRQFFNNWPDNFRLQNICSFYYKKMHYQSLLLCIPFIKSRTGSALLLWVLFGLQLFAISHGLTVGVYEHRPAPASDLDIPLDIMKSNLVFYRSAVEEAARSSIDLLVFPEYGLHVSAPYSSRDSLLPYLQTIPTEWSPCQSTVQPPSTAILHELSCMAASYQITLVVNLGTVHYCNATADIKCPPDGRYQYNTNIVFNKTGHLIATYFKYNLFGEVNFNQPPLQHVTFDEGGTKFGLSICFDLLFKDPAIELVEQHGAQVVIMPSYWFNRIPFLALYEIAEAWAVRMDVYLLVAGIHMPELAYTGSGIFGPTGVVNYTYVPDFHSGGKLVVANIPNRIQPKVNIKLRDTRQKPFENPDKSLTFETKTNGDLFTYTKITPGMNKTATVCQKEFCCQLKYSLVEGNPTNGFFGLGAFSGMHTENYTLCNEVCAVIRCNLTKLPNGTEVVVCGDGMSKGAKEFTELSLQGTFSDGTYQFPTVLEDDARLMKRGDWSFDSMKRELRLSTQNSKLLTLSLYGRCYNRDP